MQARQAEGVAGLWNKLAQHDAALLADEVGTGKTLQVLGVMAMLWRMKPGARVLVMAPNREICRHWQREYEQFVASHYRQSDNRVRRTDNGAPVHAALLAPRLADLADACVNQESRFFLTTIHTLSHLLGSEHEPGNSDADRPGAAAAEASKLHDRIREAFDGEGFDLLVLDEAHYFRNSHRGSLRAAAAKAFFGQPPGRLARRSLLMTATPSHGSMADITRILSLVAEVEGESPEHALKKYALRRLRRMQGRDTSHDKYSYRCEKVLPVDFSDPRAEMFFALYQKMLVEQQQVAGGRRYLYGYLEGFESFSVEADKSQEDAPDDASHPDYHGAPDTRILKRLSQMLGGLPPHPKYDELIRACVPQDIFAIPDASDNALHQHKHLVFVRRIPSVREITARVNARYDEQMAAKIIAAWKLAKPKSKLIAWRDTRWSRAAFNRLFRFKDQEPRDGLPTAMDSALAPPEEGDPVVYSQIAQLFVEKASGEAPTDCSLFRSRLRRPESAFSLLLEPASDYRQGTYTEHHRRLAGDRERDEYLSATLAARTGEVSSEGVIPLVGFAMPMPTLWGMIVDLLERSKAPQLGFLDKIIANPALAESFGQYVKHGFMYASPVIVELYCWYVEFRSGETQVASAQERYLAFTRFIRPRLAQSLVPAYFCAALETFEQLYRRVPGVMRKEWRSLIGLSSPGFYASGEVNDRQRLIIGFNSPFYPNVLASTSVLQEGVDLHLQCSKVHHYGIAWTPGDNEQRVGRVDRMFGKVNAHLQRDGRAELAIHYPYLARSFDEEQLASFIRQKYDVEDRMDACKQKEVHSDIDLRHATDGWQAFLRRPDTGRGVADNGDPYPFEPDERPKKDYQLDPRDG
ncbi:helicase domain-containing protein [Herbaspirillum frisingense GSF30]|uniref:Helicase domain-containing protein n=2 Tax=Herbaspirillum frisingense TaxID=92645 RepID=A0AAI9IB49_9BURK|nr:helicase domain-containing protein [Herbaspirillum frisingense GSF30]